MPSIYFLFPELDYLLSIHLSHIDRNYHNNKTKLAKDAGITLIHIFENDWISTPELCKSRIQNMVMTTNTKIMARKCIIKPVNTSVEREFLNNNHIQGYVASKLCYGLYYDGALVCLMSFSASRFTSDTQWELIRCCTTMSCVVQGGASKLFTHFIKGHSPTSVVSFSDRARNTGGVYNTLGFKYHHTSKPNYKYFHKSNRLKLLSRVKFQKHKLHKHLPRFDPDLSEWENMKANGYNRIWDCGSDVFVWRC